MEKRLQFFMWFVYILISRAMFAFGFDYLSETVKPIVFDALTWHCPMFFCGKGHVDQLIIYCILLLFLICHHEARFIDVS